MEREATTTNFSNQAGQQSHSVLLKNIVLNVKQEIIIHFAQLGVWKLNSVDIYSCLAPSQSRPCVRTINCAKLLPRCAHVRGVGGGRGEGGVEGVQSTLFFLFVFAKRCAMWVCYSPVPMLGSLLVAGD